MTLKPEIAEIADLPTNLNIEIPDIEEFKKSVRNGMLRSDPRLALTNLFHGIVPPVFLEEVEYLYASSGETLPLLSTGATEIFADWFNANNHEPILNIKTNSSLESKKAYRFASAKSNPGIVTLTLVSETNPFDPEKDKLFASPFTH